MAKVKVTQEHIAGFMKDKQSTGNKWAIEGHKRTAGNSPKGSGENDTKNKKATRIAHLNA